MHSVAAGNHRLADSARERTKARIYGEIVSKIVTGELNAGHRLKEQDLAQTYKVSRTPIREILIALEKDGLVKRIRNRGAEVISMTADDLEHIYDIRISLECLAVRRATTHMPLNDLLSFEQRLEALDRRKVPSWHQHLAELDGELHRFIVSESRNPLLQTYLRNIAYLIDSLRLSGRHEEAYDRRGIKEHLEIIRALIRRDRQLVERLLADHIENSKNDVLRFFFRKRETVKRHAMSQNSVSPERKPQAEELHTASRPPNPLYP